MWASSADAGPGRPSEAAGGPPLTGYSGGRPSPCARRCSLGPRPTQKRLVGSGRAAKMPRTRLSGWCRGAEPRCDFDHTVFHADAVEALVCLYGTVKLPRGCRLGFASRASRTYSVVCGMASELLNCVNFETGEMEPADFQAGCRPQFCCLQFCCPQFCCPQFCCLQFCCLQFC